MPWSQRLVFLFLFLLLTCAAPTGWTQVYSWVDENGRKHYGDTISPEYKNQATEVKLSKPNTAAAVEVDSSAAPKSAAGSERRKPNIVIPGGGEPSCEERWEAYRQSQECFMGCRALRGGRINTTACGHCTNVKKPDC